MSMTDTELSRLAFLSHGLASNPAGWKYTLAHYKAVDSSADFEAMLRVVEVVFSTRQPTSFGDVISIVDDLTASTEDIKHRTGIMLGWGVEGGKPMAERCPHCNGTGKMKILSVLLFVLAACSSARPPESPKAETESYPWMKLAPVERQVYVEAECEKHTQTTRSALFELNGWSALGETVYSGDAHHLAIVYRHTSDRGSATDCSLPYAGLFVHSHTPPSGPPARLLYWEELSGPLCEDKLIVPYETLRYIKQFEGMGLASMVDLDLIMDLGEAQTDGSDFYFCSAGQMSSR